MLHHDVHMDRTVTRRYGKGLIPLALVFGLAGGIGGTLLVQPRTTVAQTRVPAAGPSTTMVHLSQYGGDLHAVLMALEAAGSVQKVGGNVTLLLDLEGVRLADTRLPSDVPMHPHVATVHEKYDKLVKGGAQVLVCAHCASVAGIDKASLRAGARLVRDEELGKAIQGANQILDY